MTSIRMTLTLLVSGASRRPARSETAASIASSAWSWKLEVSPSLNSLIGVTTAILIIILELNKMADGKAV